MIGAIGINYKSSPLEIREKFSLSEKSIEEFGNQLKDKPGFSGLIVISTCNRSEFYFNMTECCGSSVFSFMLRSLKGFCGVTENVRDYFYFKSEEEAYEHLFNVVVGAKSMVYGEIQIVGQVKQALQISIDNDLTDSELSRLFTKALEASKKIRTLTKMNEGALSISYAGIEKCISVFPNIQECSFLLVGAGETGELTLKSLIKKGCKNITIANRTVEKANKLANSYDVSSIPFESIQTQLEYSDVVIVSTGSQVPLITRDMVQLALKNKDQKKQLYIDLSVPRNVSPMVSDIENVTVYDVDDLQEVVNSHLEKRKGMVHKVDAIVNEYVVEFSDWISNRNLGSVISQIKSNFHTINSSELQGFKKVNKASNNPLLDNYGSHITEKYTRLLIKNMKEVTNNGKNLEYVKVLSELFELN